MSQPNIDWGERAQALKLQVRNFIAGRWVPGSGGEMLEKYAPRDGKLLVSFGAGQASDAEEAVVTARRAFEDGRWSKLSVERRKEVLYKLAALMQERREELALLECLDVGKPISDALNIDVPMAAAAIRYSAEGADKLYGKVFGVDPSSLSYELRRPMGVVAGIVGWNFPLVLAASKVGPALATGNCLVLKPSELTSLSAGRMAELALEAGVPEGVLNVVHGGGAIGAALAQHNDVDLVSFTGSSQTGKKLMIAAGQSNMKRLILECGGKAPNIVFDDSPDLETIADAIVARMFWNQGQVCTASSRLLIQQDIKDRLLPILIERSAELGMGDPLNSHTKFGAVVSEGHRQKVLGYIDNGRKEGARIAYQSDAKAPFEAGFYVAPVIFDQVSARQKIAQEEIFGPVVSVIGFRNEDEAIDIANNTIYGLSAILWTTDMGRAHRMSQAIRAGWIVVNATGKALGGAEGITVGGHKQSGIGAEGGLEGMEAYLSKTTVQYFV
jgi:acyl-CoA reductase-like NAD-dependent aldehyde dehydrogenase